MAELFAGVGGFREAVEHSPLKNHFEVSWSNQWEPSESAKHGDLQNANKVYIAKFGNEGHYTDDIHLITDSEKKLPKDIADIQMLVGGQSDGVRPLPMIPDTKTALNLSF